MRVVPLYLLLVVGLAVCGCGRDAAISSTHPASTVDSPIVRVRLLAGKEQATLAVTEPPVVWTSRRPQPVRLDLPRNTPLTISVTTQGWQLAAADQPLQWQAEGELFLQAAHDGALSIDGESYRGRLRLVPVGADRFDVINDVEIDAYLRSVVSRELLRHWHEEAYKAQAIAARTYALYVARTEGSARHWDLHPDTRSQVYGGIGSETHRSRSAVDATTGVVLAYGPTGRERIFKAYYSACCGGIGHSAADAFGESHIEPLSEQNVHSLCNAAPRFNWGPIELTREEVTSRFRTWGERRGRPEKDIETVVTIEVQSTNRYGRPSRFVVTDERGARYSLGPEEIRWALNSNATRETTFHSSFFRPVNDPNSDSIRFVDGHGHGHGVGLCQWCTQRRAELGMRHEQIVLLAYPGAKLIRAY